MAVPSSASICAAVRFTVVRCRADEPGASAVPKLTCPSGVPVGMYSLLEYQDSITVPDAVEMSRKLSYKTKISARELFRHQPPAIFIIGFAKRRVCRHRRKRQQFVHRFNFLLVRHVVKMPEP